MNETWSENLPNIITEIEKLINTEASLTLSGKKLTPQIVIPISIEEKNSSFSVTFKKAQNFLGATEYPFIFYRDSKKEYLTRFFQVVPQNEDEGFLKIKMPEKIQQVSLRKHPRVSTPGNSKILFLKKNGQRIYQCNMGDVSVQGAFFLGENAFNIKKDEIIGPLNMRLCMRLAAVEETEVHVPEARVIRTVEIDPARLGISVHFDLAGDNHFYLNNYVKLRKVEEKEEDEEHTSFCLRK